MNLLAFDTGTEVMSVAVARQVHGCTRQWQHTSAGGAQASNELIPAILVLLAQADLALTDLQAICFGCGPGSFTGLRTACSVAQGLALGANVPVLPVDSLLAVAEDARFTALGAHTHGVVTALLDARMDEMYAATYAFAAEQWSLVQDAYLVRPEALMAQPSLQGEFGSESSHQQGRGDDVPWVLAGNVFAVYGERVGANAFAARKLTRPTAPPMSHPLGSAVLRIPALPNAPAMLRLAPQLLRAGLAVDAEHAQPRYVRDKVAQTTAERAAEKAAAMGAKAP